MNRKYVVVASPSNMTASIMNGIVYSNMDIAKDARSTMCETMAREASGQPYQLALITAQSFVKVYELVSVDL